MRRKNKQKKLPLPDNSLSNPINEIMDDLKRRINNLTGVKTIEENDDVIVFKTRNMTYATLIPMEDYVEVVCELPYDRILDMSRKCEVKSYATDDKNDIVSYKVKTKFDIQYAVSIVQQSFMYRKRLIL